MLEMPSATIRAWEERYGVVVPARSEGAHRVYTREQVAHLRYLKQQVEAGLSAADAHRLLAERLESGQGDAVSRSDGDDEVPPVVLIAERDPYAAELAEYFLETEGYDVRVALDAEHARVEFSEHPPQVVIIDLLISGGAGFRLSREFCDARSIHLLAASILESTDEALNAGASVFLRKPLEPLQLVSTVRDLLGTSALTRGARRPVGA